MTPDQINGLFELTGAVLTAKNFLRVLEDKGHAGIYPPAVVFFTLWGLWNLFYYPSLGQAWSFFGGVILVISNLFWLGAMIYYGRREDPGEV